MTKQIQLTKGKVAVVDDEDFERVSKYRWFAEETKAGIIYAVANLGGSRKEPRRISMHRFITNAPKGMLVDHKDMNGLKNTRANLRVCTRSQNSANRNANKNSKTGFKGVRRVRNGYQAQIDSIYLGYFTDPVEAAKAYDKAARELFGEFARTNF